jgi:hypothetical protein
LPFARLDLHPEDVDEARRLASGLGVSNSAAMCAISSGLGLLDLPQAVEVVGQSAALGLARLSAS